MIKKLWWPLSQDNNAVNLLYLVLLILAEPA